jgi:hypothetical protein
MKTISNETMKPNHKDTYSSAPALSSVLAYVNPRSLAVVLFIGLALLDMSRGNATGLTKSAHTRAGEVAKGAIADLDR